MVEAAVTGRGLVLRRGTRTVLASADLDFPAGALTALIGPNGAGKSSLLDAIAGLLPVAEGALSVLGQRPRDARSRVAYVLQATRVNEAVPLTVAEVVTMGRYQARGLFGRLGSQDRDAVTEAMARLGLVDLAARHLGELSGGQRQRALVAQGLAQRADVLLMDEPLAGVDLASRRRIVRAVTDEVARGCTVLLATHDLGEAAMATSVVLLAGRVAASGPPAEVITAEQLSAAYGAQVVQLGGDNVLLDEHMHPH